MQRALLFDLAVPVLLFYQFCENPMTATASPHAIQAARQALSLMDFPPA